MAKIFVFFWCIAGLLTLDIALRAPAGRRTAPALRETPDTLPLVTQIRTRCELPEGTLVFVVRERERSP